MNKSVKLGLLGLVAVGGVSGVWYLATTATVHVVNELPIDLSVSLAGQTTKVAQGTRVELGRVKGGTHELIALGPDGGVVEQLPVVVSTTGTNVYNALGAAQVVVDAIWYSPAGTQSNEPRRTELCGRSFSTQRVDFPFEEPPRSIETKDRGASQRTVLSVAGKGPFACLNATTQDPTTLAELALRLRTVVAAEGALRLTWYAVERFKRAGQTARAAELAEPLLNEPDGDLEHHRAIQDLMRMTGRLQEAQKLYRERYEREPNADNAYLVSRLLKPKEAVPLATKALKRWPDSVPLHRTKLWNEEFLNESEAVVEDADWLLAHAPADSFDRDLVLAQAAAARVRLGHSNEALEHLKASLEPQREWNLKNAITVARAAAVSQTKPWVNPFTRLHRDGNDDATGFRYFFEASAGLAGPPSGTLGNVTGFRLLDLSVGYPAQALKLVREAASSQPLYLTEELAWLLLVEAWRTEDEKAAARLAGFISSLGEEADAKRWLHDGGEDDVLAELVPEARFAMLLGRARTLEASGETAQAAQMFERLKDADPLRGLAVRAIEGWAKRGTPGAEPSVHLKATRKVKLD